MIFRYWYSCLYFTLKKKQKNISLPGSFQSGSSFGNNSGPRWFGANMSLCLYLYFNSLSLNSELRSSL